MSKIISLKIVVCYPNRLDLLPNSPKNGKWLLKEPVLFVIIYK